MRLPVLKSSQVITILKKLGFQGARQTGGHLILKHELTKRIIPVPIHGKKDLKKGVLRSIIKQTGLKVDEFLKLK